MLQDPRPRDRAVLCDVTDDQNDRSRFLRKPRQFRRCKPHLPDAAGRALRFGGKDGLDGVNDQNIALCAPRFLKDSFKRRFAQQQHIAFNVQTIRAQFELCCAFFTRDVKNGAALCDRIRSLHEQRGFSDTGITAEQRYHAGEQSAARNTI